jgi:uncharacterized protein YgbK (DUF1537 family)
MIADDLTGAMDAGVAAISHGIAASVCLDDDHLGELAARAGLVVIDTESRNIPRQDAFDAVRRAALRAEAVGARVVYKKIDSTLRGNIGAEIDAMLDAGVTRTIVLAPALPGRGRTTRGGIQYVNGARLDETEFARDPLALVTSSHIESIVASQSKVRTRSIGLQAVRRGGQPLSALLLEEASLGAGALIVDAELDSDLEHIAQALEHLAAAGGPGEFLGCGSAGLFGKMRPGAYAGRLRHVSKARTHDRGHGPQVVVVSASPAEVSREQVEYALATLPDLVPVQIDVSALEGDGGAEAAVLRSERQVKDAVQTGRNLVLGVKGPGRGSLLQWAGSTGELRKRSAALLEMIGGLARVAFEQGRPGALVLIGGDTAWSVARAMDAHGIHILGQVEPHVPYGVIAGGAHDGLRVVTKAGGFGDESTLARILEFMTQAG